MAMTDFKTLQNKQRLYLMNVCLSASVSVCLPASQSCLSVCLCVCLVCSPSFFGSIFVSLFSFICVFT